MGTRKSLITNILQNNLFYVQWKKETHLGLRTWGWVNDDRIFILGELSLLISLEKIHTSLEWHEGE